MHDTSHRPAPVPCGSGRCSPDTADSTSPSSTSSTQRRSGSPTSTNPSPECSPTTWPDAPNLGDITTIDWHQVPPVDILCGGFPCQSVSTVGKMAGLSPGTPSSLWSHMAEAIDALQPEYVGIENVRADCCPRPPSEPDRKDQPMPDATPTPQPPTTLRSQPFATWNPTRGIWEMMQPDLCGRSAPFSAIWSTCGETRDGSAYRRPLSAFLTTGSAASSAPTSKTLFRTPLASDSSHGGESLERVRAQTGHDRAVAPDNRPRAARTRWLT